MKFNKLNKTSSFLIVLKFGKGKRTQVFQDFWRGLQVLDSCICHYNLDSEFQSLVGFRIPWAVLRIPKPRIPDFFYIPRAKFSRIPDSTSPHFRHFGIRIPLHGVILILLQVCPIWIYLLCYPRKAPHRKRMIRIDYSYHHRHHHQFY